MTGRSRRNRGISREGQWPLYIPLYQNKGLLIGCLNVTNEADSDLSGQVSWIKPPSANGSFASGFNFQTNVIGSAYVGTNSPILDLSLGSLLLTGGNLPVEVKNPLSWRTTTR